MPGRSAKRFPRVVGDTLTRFRLLSSCRSRASQEPYVRVDHPWWLLMSYMAAASGVDGDVR
jgi:hypothetical protein